MGRFVTELAGFVNLFSKKRMFLALAERDRTDPIAHPPPGNHSARECGRFFEVALSTGGKFIIDNLFGRPSTHCHCQVIMQTPFSNVQILFVRPKLSDSQSATTRDNCDLVDLIDSRQEPSHQSVSGFVVSRHPASLLRELFFPLGPHQDPVFCLFKFECGDVVSIGSDSQQRRFIDEVFQFCPRESRRRLGDLFQLDVISERHLFRVHLENLLAAFLCRTVDSDVAIETTRSHERRVEHVRPVCCGNDNHRRRLLKAVHLTENLVERLLALIVSAAKSRTAVTPDGVDFIDEDDAGRVVLRVLKQVSDTTRPDTHKHLNEF